LFRACSRLSSAGFQFSTVMPLKRLDPSLPDTMTISRTSPRIETTTQHFDPSIKKQVTRKKTKASPIHQRIILSSIFDQFLGSIQLGSWYAVRSFNLVPWVIRSASGSVLNRRINPMRKHDTPKTDPPGRVTQQEGTTRI
jgi:hypothetical protein